MRQLVAVAAQQWAVLLLILCSGATPPAAAEVPACPELAVQGRIRFPFGKVCAWPKQPPAPRQGHIELLGEAAGMFPGFVLSSSTAPSPGASSTGLYSTDWCHSRIVQEQPAARPLRDHFQTVCSCKGS